MLGASNAILNRLLGGKLPYKYTTMTHRKSCKQILSFFRMNHISQTMPKIPTCDSNLCSYHFTRGVNP